MGDRVTDRVPDEALRAVWVREAVEKIERQRVPEHPWSTRTWNAALDRAIAALQEDE